MWPVGHNVYYRSNFVLIFQDVAPKYPVTCGLMQKIHFSCFAPVAVLESLKSVWCLYHISIIYFAYFDGF